MKELMKLLGRWLCAYGRYGAGVPSYHGTYEAPVPEELQRERGE